MKREYADANAKLIKDKGEAEKASAVASKNEPVSDGETKPTDAAIVPVVVPAPVANGTVAAAAPQAVEVPTTNADGTPGAP